MPAPTPERVDGRTERWRAHRERRRAEFIDAAFEAMREHGPDVSMEQLAAAAGTVKPKLYRHFASKADLVAAITERSMEMVFANITDGIDLEASLRELLRHGLDGYLQFVEEHPEVVRFLMEHSLDPGTPGLLLDRARSIAQMFVAIASADLEGVHVPTQEIGPLAHALVGAVAGATDWWVIEAPENRMTRQRLVEQLTIVLSSAAEAQLKEWGVGIDLDRPGVALHLGMAVSVPSRE